MIHRHSILRLLSLLATAVLAVSTPTMTVLDQVPAVQHPIRESIEAQSTFCLDDGKDGRTLVAPPVEHFLVWTRPGQNRAASVAYTGLANKAIVEAGGASLGTLTEGTVLGRHLTVGAASDGLPAERVDLFTHGRASTTHFNVAAALSACPGRSVCDDGNPCTSGDTCKNGVCVGTPNTISCNDGNACTHTDTCGGGVCSGTAYSCNDGNVCTTDTCDGAGGCNFTNNTTPCTDGNACTTGDTCSGGTCVSGSPTVCDDGNVCTTDSCDPAAGCCIFTSITGPCSDGNACTTGDTCCGGTCVPGSPTVLSPCPEFIWTRQFGTPSPDRALGVAVDASGVYVAGETFGAFPGQTSAGSVDAIVRKYDVDGNEVWTRQFGSGSADFARGVAVDASGVYVAGETDGALPGQTSAGRRDAFVRKYDVDGNVVWTRQFGSASDEFASGVAVDGSGVYVAGETDGALPGQTFAGGFSDAFVRKYDVDGNEVWTRQFGTSARDRARGVAVDASGVYVTGETAGAFPGQANAGLFDAFVRKYDVDGNEVWTRQFGTSAHDFPRGVAVDASGVYVAGETGGALPGQTNADGLSDAFVRKYDVDGNEVWTRQFGSGGGQGDFARGVAVDASGVYVAGGTGGALPGQTSAGFVDAFVRKYDVDGNEVWTRQCGSCSDDFASGVAVDASSVYVAGETWDNLAGQTSAGFPDAFVAKLSR